MALLVGWDSRIRPFFKGGGLLPLAEGEGEPHGCTPGHYLLSAGYRVRLTAPPRNFRPWHPFQELNCVPSQASSLGVGYFLLHFHKIRMEKLPTRDLTKKSPLFQRRLRFLVFFKRFHFPCVCFVPILSGFFLQNYCEFPKHVPNNFEPAKF